MLFSGIILYFVSAINTLLSQIRKLPITTILKPISGCKLYLWLGKVALTFSPFTADFVPGQKKEKDKTIFQLCHCLFPLLRYSKEIPVPYPRGTLCSVLLGFISYHLE